MLERDTVYVGGAWIAPSTMDLIDVVDPATETAVASVPLCSPPDVDRAVAAARAALPGWSSTSPGERAARLAALRDALEARAEDVARIITIEMGAPVRLSEKVHVGLPLQILSSYVELLAWYSFESRVGNSLVVREPVGVVGAITSWSQPLIQAVSKVAAALAAGCTVVHKPSEQAPLSAYFLAEIAHEAGLPPGVYNMIPGTGGVVGEALAGHEGVDLVSFTGSTSTGTRVAELASTTVTRTILELSGKSAAIVLPDGDLERAVRATVARCFADSGQDCRSLSRLLVHRSQHDEALGLAKEAAETFVVGPPGDPETKIGPLASSRQRERVLECIDRAVADGVRLVTGGSAPEGLSRGYYVSPTVLGDVRAHHRVAQEEVFGPVLSVMPYADLAEAVSIANATPFGLVGSVWAADPQAAVAVARKIRAGQVDINGARFNPRAPAGGFGRSGTGRELGVHGLEAFTEVKSLQL